MDIVGSEKYQRAFITNYSTLIRKLAGVEVVEIAFSKFLISQSEYQEINSHKTESSKIKHLLGILFRRYYGNHNIFEEFLNVLEEVNDKENGIIDNVINALHNAIKSPPEFPSPDSFLREFDLARLQLNESTIVATLDVLQILPDLISEGVVTVLEAENIEVITMFEQRGVKLVDILRNKGSDVFKRFVEVLRESETYERLADKLSRTDGEINGGTEQDDKKYVERALKDGHVPPIPRNCIRRVELVKSIRRELRKMKDVDKWLVIYGLPGYGKTVLAADSVAQASLLRDIFPGGVFWLSVGKMRDTSGEMNTAALLEKVQNFILRMDKDKYRPPNLESASDYLQSVMSEQHPRSLLILDDVWEHEAAQAFSVRCRTLVTTRNYDIADGVHTNGVCKVSVTEGFTQNEGLSLLSKYTRVPIPDLPFEANQIIKLSYGSPIVMDIIGASLTKSSGRWSIAVDRLKTQHPGGLKTGNSPYLRSRRPSEQKKGAKATLNTSIQMTEESLPEETRQYFRWLVVFEKDVVIKVDTLATIWDMNRYDVVDIVEELRTWSLIKQAHIHSNTVSCDNSNGTTTTSNDDDYDDLPSYTIHNMIMDYLRDRVESDTQQQYHKQLVDRYASECNGDFAALKPDGYIHKKLLFHIYSSGVMMDLLATLLGDLRWLATCVRCWDANSLLAFYKKYKVNVPEKYVSMVDDFQLFLSSNLDLLATEPSLSDVVQLALTTLHSDTLVQQAQQEVEKDKDTMYLLWNNRLSSKRPGATLKLQPHLKEVRHCQYYDKGTNVVSCSSDSVKLWKSSTGELLETFTGHENTMTHCAISEDGSLLVVTSEDCKCNVWDVNQHSLLHKFNEHYDGIQCCSLSSDNKLVVTADIGSFVKVWSCERPDIGTIIGEWTHGDNGTTSCVFLPSGKEVVVADQYTFITMYTIDGTPLSSFALSPTTSQLSQSGNTSDLIFSRGPSRSSSSSSSTSGTGHHVNSCVIDNSGKMLGAAISDGTARVWSITSFEQLHSFPHYSDVLSADFSPDSTLLLTGSAYGVIKVWSLIQQCAIFDLPLHYDWVMCSKFSPSGSHILTASFQDGIIKVTPLVNDDEDWKLYKRRFSVHFDMDVNGSYSPRIICYDAKSRALEVCEGLTASTVSVIGTNKSSAPRSWSLSPDGKMVVLGYDDGLLQLFSVSENKLMWSQEKAHSEQITNCYFSPDGSKIVSCREHHKVWTVTDGTLLSEQENSEEFFLQPCVFYSDSIRIASAIKSGEILVWKSTDGKKLFNCNDIGDDSSILCVNISKDNTRLVASNASGYTTVWDAESGQTVFTSCYSSDELQAARYCSLDRHGTLVAVGHDNCQLKLYNTVTGEEVTCPNKVSGSWMISTQFSPDDQQIVTLSNSIQWWSRDGKLLKQFILKSIFGKYLWFSPDFKTFVTIDNTGLLYVLSVL